MKNVFISLSLFFMALTSSLAQQNAADIVILNGKVFTVDQEHILAEAVAIRGDQIIAVGTYKTIKGYISEGKTKVINAKGRLVLPGFNDAHAHFGPLDPDYIELRYLTDPEIITTKVKAAVEKSYPGQLIEGGHWDHETFVNKKWPSKELIDPVSPDNPVILSRADGHSVLVNSYVLKASGITNSTPDPFGGVIVKDSITGEPTGILKESAQNLIKTGEVKSKRTEKEEKERTWRGYLLALKEARELGVTSIQIPGEADFEAYDQLQQKDELTSRIDIGGELTDDSDKLRKYQELEKLYPREGKWIRFGYLKGFIDGTIGSGTALMFEPFTDNPSTSGLSTMPYDVFEKMVIKADKLGFQIGVHAIGDKGNNWVLNAFEKAEAINGRHNCRYRIEHAQNLRQSDIPRFARIGVIASMQPTHCISDKKFCDKRIGSERAKGAYAWRSLLDSGSVLAFGTDYQVEPLNPMEGLYAAVTRKDRHGEKGDGWHPEQKLSMAEAIKYYTYGSAYAQFMEDRKGIIKTGYLADIVILDRDLFSIPEDQIMNTKVDYTITGGKIVYESGKK